MENLKNFLFLNFKFLNLKILNFLLFNIKHHALNSLLTCLKQFGHSDLPKDARTLLHTPTTTAISPLGTGSYSHYGLEKGLINQLTELIADKIPRNIVLDFNIDGLPLSKSSGSQVWPILFKIVNFPDAVGDPFVVGIYHGEGKPQNINLFLEPTILEYLKLNRREFIFNNKNYKIILRLFIADTLARNYIMYFPPHNSRCGRCIQVGETIQHRRVFLDNFSPERTSDSFRLDVLYQ